MIAFDNGPPDGDYVRYIDELLASRAALSVVTNATASDDFNEGNAPGRSPLDLIRERARVAVDQAIASTGRMTPSVPVTPPVNRGPGAQTSSAAATSSMMRGGQTQVGTGLIASLATGLVGAMLLLVGVLSQAFNGFVTIAGLALIAWSVRQQLRRTRFDNAMTRRAP